MGSEFNIEYTGSNLYLHLLSRLCCMIKVALSEGRHSYVVGLQRNAVAYESISKAPYIRIPISPGTLTKVTDRVPVSSNRIKVPST